MKHLLLFLLPVFLLLPTKALPQTTQKTRIDKTLAGYSLEKNHPLQVEDTKKGYILLRSGDCDGTHLFLALFPKNKRKKTIYESGSYHIQKVHLRNLATDRGIEIGMSRKS
jgi:hypothetical protein